MSKRHQSSRRKSYGRRQLEVRERNDRVQPQNSGPFELDDWGTAPPSDPLAFVDPRTPRFRYAGSD